MGYISTKLHQFLISSFRDYLQTDRQTDRQTDTQTNKTPSSMCAGKNWLRLLITKTMVCQKEYRNKNRNL